MSFVVVGFRSFGGRDSQLAQATESQTDHLPQAHVHTYCRFKEATKSLFETTIHHSVLGRKAERNTQTNQHSFHKRIEIVAQKNRNLKVKSESCLTDLLLAPTYASQVVCVSES